MGNRFSLLTVNLGRSRDPAVEREVLAEVGSYGRQLGRMQEALAVLVAHFPEDGLAPEQKRALAAFRVLFNEMAEVKARHGDRPVLRFEHGTGPQLTSG